ncbi:cohesin complex subunit, partial [Linderina macrospora]
MSSSRRSTRTVKAPERLDATPAASKKRATKTRSSKSATASNKRRKTPKRKGAQRRHISDDEDDNDEDASEVAESESEGDLDDASDYEAEKAPAPRTPRKQTAVAKKPTAKQKPAAKQKKQTAKAIAVLASSSAEANMEITVEESLLLTTIQDDRVALTQVASDWIDSYRDDCDGALCELINFLIRLTGCPSKITEEAVYDSDEIGAVLEGLQKQCITALKQGGASSAEAADGLLMGKAKEQRKFRKNALQFVVKVIEVGQHQLVFDQVSDDNRLSTFTEVLLQWLVNMAGSSYRPFRHVATLITMAVQSALVGIRVRISAEQQTTHRQLEAEQSRQLKSRRNNRESARGEQLRARVAELTEQDELAEAAFKAFYDTVFIYRYRDVHAIIRSECLVPLASWCRAYPAS